MRDAVGKVGEGPSVVEIGGVDDVARCADVLGEREASGCQALGVVEQQQLSIRGSLERRGPIPQSSDGKSVPSPNRIGRSNGRQSCRGWASRSATIQSTAGSCPIPRWLLRTATFSLRGPGS